MSDGPFRGLDAGMIATVSDQVPLKPGLRRPAVVQVLGWLMVCWAAYMHTASRGGDRAMAVSGSLRVTAPQWAQVRGPSVVTG